MQILPALHFGNSFVIIYF